MIPPNAQEDLPPRHAAAIAAARGVGEELLWPAAQTTDGAERVPAGHLDALADAGLFAMAGPQRLDGVRATQPVVREIMRSLGGACGATAFVFAQHHGLVNQLQLSDNDALVERWLGRLCEGEALAGIMFAHLRRPGPPAVSATRVDGGWRIDGDAPWATSWGMADVFLLAAQTDDRRIVWSAVPTDSDTPIGRATPFDLPVMASTRTVRVSFDGLFIADSDVVRIVPVDDWVLPDRLRAAAPNHLALGVGDRTLALLADIEPDVADGLRSFWDKTVAVAYEASAAVDTGTDDADPTWLADARAEVLDAIVRLTTIYTAASGGKAVDLSHPAQRLAREAMFYVIQAQTTDGRAATLRRLSSGPQ